MKMFQIKYLKYYRKAQAAQGTVWFRYYMHKLSSLAIRPVFNYMKI